MKRNILKTFLLLSKYFWDLVFILSSFSSPKLVYLLLTFRSFIFIYPRFTHCNFIFIILFFRGRGVASGVCAGSFYIFAFLVTKTWLNLQSLVDLHGCFIVYGVITIIGILYVFICLPETEGKTLAEIEKHFSKK